MFFKARVAKKGKENIPAEKPVGSVDIGLSKKRGNIWSGLCRARARIPAHFSLSLNRWKSSVKGAGSWEGPGNTRMEPSPAGLLCHPQQRCPGIPWTRIPHGIPGLGWKSSSMSRVGIIPLEWVFHYLDAGILGCPQFPACIPRISPSGSSRFRIEPLLGTAMDPLPIPGFLELGGFGIPEGMAVIQKRNENQESAPSLPP